MGRGLITVGADGRVLVAGVNPEGALIEDNEGRRLQSVSSSVLLSQRESPAGWRLAPSSSLSDPLPPNLTPDTVDH